MIAGSASAARPGINANGLVISSGSSGTFTTPGELVFNRQGFNPQEGLREDDYGYTAWEAIPVALAYHTEFPDEAGQFVSYPDIYGSRLAKANQ